MAERRQIDGLRHSRIALVVGMQAIVAHEIPPHRLGLSGVLGRLVKLRDAVELAAPADKGVDGLARGLRAVVEALRAAKGRQRAADDLDAAQVQAGDHLAIGGDHLVRAAAGMGRVAVMADVIDALDQHHVGDAGQ